ncbi:uncharacterized protein LOC118756776 [Rhagoletis pomonella]|uniref:uncharacterized protein LOC118756776 n=1 Tax=Rhagoletis pomonella TaxID=28610 RepID=UPI0017877763|nr:uncharacterized protein LOC118756776 [Rhagoletis pomonella]
MMKLSNLTVAQLNVLLRNNELAISGNKAHKVAALMEFLGTDEVELQEVPSVEPWEQPFNQLQELVLSLANSVKSIEIALKPATRASDNDEGEAERIVLVTEGGAGAPEPSPQRSLPMQLVRATSVPEVVGVLPEFDPLRKTMTAQQFVTKVEQLQQVYRWKNETVLLAVQHKMKGIAKNWLDAQPVFGSWSDFVRMLLQDFPYTVTAADIHRELAARRRKPNEPLIEYFYEMLTIGRRGGVDEESINSYIINGLNDSALTRTLLAMNVRTCNDLRQSIESLRATTQASGQRFAQNVTSSDVSPVSAEDKGKRVKCYNCNVYGHYAAKCPQPQKKLRCSKCSKVGHDAKKCTAADPKHTVAKIECNVSTQQKSPPIVEEIECEGVKYQALVDTGSDHSLIRTTAAINSEHKTPTFQRLQGFGGSVVEVTQVIDTAIKLKDEVIKAKLYEVPDSMLNYDLLLGRDVLCGHDRRLIIDAGSMMLQIKNAQQFNVNEGLQDDGKQTVFKLLTDYDDCFSEGISTLGRSKTTTMSIEVTTPSPIVGRRYQVPFAKQQELSSILKELLANEVIRPSTSPHAASVVLVTKANGESRMCVDYRALNAVTIRKHFPMPVVEEQLSKLSGGRFFTTLDMTSGYYQIPIKEECKKYTAFLTHEGLYEHNVMPFGLVNAPMIFQEMVVKMISTLKSRNKVVSYVDEVIIATSSCEEGIAVLEEVLDAVRRDGLTLRPSKCQFLSNEVRFLGHEISSSGIAPGEMKTQCIKEFPRPTNVTQVRQFLGLTGFFRKFVGRYSQLACPLTMLLKKDISFQWEKQQQEAFIKLKEAITSKPVLTLYDPGKQHEVHTDASHVGLSGILFQCENEGEKPVFFYSRQCSVAETRFPSHELEVLAIVEALTRFRMYLLGKPFTVVTDCNAIVTTKAKTPLLPRIARWWLKLQEFDFKTKHRQGHKMQHVDGMSRAPCLPPTECQTVAEHVLAVTTEGSSDWVFAMQMQDKQLQEIVSMLMSSSASAKQIQHDYELHKGRLYKIFGFIV